MKTISFLAIFSVALVFLSYQQKSRNQNQNVKTERKPETQKIPVIFDTDANNELDDQHALAYLLFNGDVFDIEGITVNRTYNGGSIEKHMEEAERVVELCAAEDLVEVYKGASGSFEDIKPNLQNEVFDGFEAVNFIIERAKAVSDEKLLLLPVGKLTNIALALEKDPSIKSNVRIVWLGSNYPEPGEYNQDNDIPAVNYILNTDVPFEVVLVRYGKSSGTSAVRATPQEIYKKMPGTGPEIEEPVVGRHGGRFTNFGDYAVSLFKHAKMHGDPPSRSLFDMAAVAIVKNAKWAEKKVIPAPVLINERWKERPQNERSIMLWENFDKKAIMKDFYDSMENYTLPEE